MVSVAPCKQILLHSLPYENRRKLIQMLVLYTLFFLWCELICHLFLSQHETRVLRVKVIAGIDLAKKDIIGARWASLEIVLPPKVSWPTDITVCAWLLHQFHFNDWVIKWLQKPNTSKTFKKKSPKAFKKQVYLCCIFMNYVGVITHFILIIIIIISCK